MSYLKVQIQTFVFLETVCIIDEAGVLCYCALVKHCEMEIGKNAFQVMSAVFADAEGCVRLQQDQAISLFSILCGFKNPYVE